MDDALAPGHHAATDLHAIDHRLAALAPPGSGRHIVSVWTSAGFADRYDVTVADDADDAGATIRIAGDGRVLRTRAGDALGLVDTVVVLHQTLLCGDVGGYVIGASGVLLITNLLAGLVVAWPRRGTWRRVPTPSRGGAPAARHFAWHRALGLIGVVPALLLVAAGTMLAFEDGLRTMIGGEPVTLPAKPGAIKLSFAQAAAIGEHAVPGSRLTAVTFPDKDDATYSVRLLAPTEWRRGYGMTCVFVDGTSGAIRGVFLASGVPFARAAIDFLFLFHTGEAGSLPGRLLVLAIGLWLITMVLIGLRLWWSRQSLRRRSR